MDINYVDNCKTYSSNLEKICTECKTGYFFTNSSKFCSNEMYFIDNCV